MLLLSIKNIKLDRFPIYSDSPAILDLINKRRLDRIKGPLETVLHALLGAFVGNWHSTTMTLRACSRAWRAAVPGPDLPPQTRLIGVCNECGSPNGIGCADCALKPLDEERCYKYMCVGCCQTKRRAAEAEYERDRMADIRRCDLPLVDFHRSRPGATYYFSSGCDRLVCRSCQFHCVNCNETCCKMCAEDRGYFRCDDCGMMECSECVLEGLERGLEGLDELHCDCGKGIHSGYKMVGMVLRTKEDDDQEACIPPRIWRTHSGRRKFIKGTVLKSSRPPLPQ